MPTCTNEIPLSSDSTSCDAVTCGASADLLCDEGPRCYACFEQYGGELVSEAKRPALISPTAPKPYDLGSLMCSVIDRLAGGAA